MGNGVYHRQLSTDCVQNCHGHWLEITIEVLELN